MPEDLGFGVPTPKEYYHLYRQQEEDDDDEEEEDEEEEEEGGWGGWSAAATATKVEVEEVEGGGETEEEWGIDRDRRGGVSQGAQAMSDVNVLEQKDEALELGMLNQTALQERDIQGGKGGGGGGELETVLRERKELLDELARLLGINKNVSLAEDGLAALLRINQDAKDVSLGDLRKVFKVVEEGQQGEGKVGEGGGGGGGGAAVDGGGGDAEGLEKYSEEALLRELERRGVLKARDKDGDEGHGVDSDPGS